MGGVRTAGDVFAVVMTGRMAKQKDYRTFFAAARKLLKENGAGWRFIALGGGSDREALMAEAREVIPAEAIAFPEPTLEVLHVVRTAHVGVLMSHPKLHAEGCSNSIMEYMACGLPVVCSDSGGNKELVHDGETEFVIPLADPDALAARLMWLRSHYEDAERMGKAGRNRIVREFSVGTMIDRTVAAYRKLAR